jgi:hypothetical protein
MLRRVKFWAWALFVFVAIAFLWAPAGQRFAAAPLNAFVFAAVMAWVPRCRPIARTPLCPWNWALLVYFLQLVALPLLITLSGPSPGVLPHLPSPFAINMAMLLDCLAFLTFCGIYNHCKAQRKNGATEIQAHTRSSRVARPNGGWTWPVIFALLGIASLFLGFGSLLGVLDYFNDPGFFRDYLADMSSTWRGFLALVLKPFLGFALIMTWCKWLDSGSKKSWERRSVVTLMLVLGVIVSLSTLGSNRGSFAVPLVAVATVAWVKGDQASWRTMVVAGTLVLALSPLILVYRTGGALGEDILERSELRDQMIERVDLSDTVQMYGSAPQYLGYLLEATHWGRDPHWGGVTASSVLSPAPKIGKPFRNSSGSAIFNQVIYGTTEVADQAIPFVGETYLDFNVFGVIAGYALLGWVAYRLQRAFENAQSLLEVYIWQYFSVWTLFLIFGSIAVTTQILFYSSWPAYAYLWLARQRRRHFQPRLTASDPALERA